MIEVQQNSVVILHIDITLNDNTVADSTRVSDKPAKIVMGSGDLTPGFEAQLLGLKAGSKKRFVLPPEDAFGTPDPDNIHVLSRSLFDEKIVLEKDSIIEFEQLNGPPLPGLVKAWDEENVTVDFNHPLSGHTITFDVEILGVEAA